MKNKDKKSVFDELNDYVYKNGTGVRKDKEEKKKDIQYNDTNDIEEKEKYIHYNDTVYFKILEFFYNDKNKKKFFYMTGAYTYEINPLEKDDLYYGIIEQVAAAYKPERGKFVSFFRLCFGRALYQVQKKGFDKVDIESFDDEKYDDTFDNITYKATHKEKGYKDNNEELLKEEKLETICDLLYDIMQVTVNQKRTKAEVFRIMYTDRIMTAFSDYRRERKQEFKHEKQIFDGMERPLVDYVFAEMVSSLRDISNTDLKTVKELMEYYSDLEEDKEEVEKKYLSVWGIKENKHPEYNVKLPLSNAVILAYIFIKEYEQSMRRIIPEPHDPAYISNYSKEFKELIASFYTPEMKEMMG